MTFTAMSVAKLLNTHLKTSTIVLFAWIIYKIIIMFEYLVNSNI